MGHEVVSVDFFEGSVLVSEVASLSVWAQLLSVELSAILGFVLLVQPCLGFSDPVDFCEFFRTMRVLTL